MDEIPESQWRQLIWRRMFREAAADPVAAARAEKIATRMIFAAAGVAAIAMALGVWNWIATRDSTLAMVIFAVCNIGTIGGFLGYRLGVQAALAAYAAQPRERED